jgi:MFS family permease
MKKERFAAISRQVVVLGLISLFTDFASEMLYPVMPIFLATYIGASMAIIGLIEGAAEVTAGLLKGFFGALSDKLGKRSVFVMLGYGISAIVKPLPGIIPSLGAVITARVIDRVGKGVRTAPRDALLGSYSNNENSGAVFGFHRGMDTLGAVMGPLSAIILLKYFPGNYTLIFILAFIPSLAAIFFALKVKEVKILKEVKQKYSIKEFWHSAPVEYKVLLTLFTVFSLANSSDVFLILKSRDIAKTDTTAILGYVFYNIIYAVSSYPIGILADKLGKRRIFIIGLYIFSIVYFGFALNTSYYFMWLLFTLYGIYASATEGVSKAWISDLVENKYRGTAIGLFTGTTSIAVMLGSVMAGFLWDEFGSQFPFLISAALSLLIASFLLFYSKTTRNGAFSQ